MEKKKKLAEKLEKKIYLKDQSLDVTNKQLIEYFEKFGNVRNAYILMDNKNRAGWGLDIFLKEKKIKKTKLSFLK